MVAVGAGGVGSSATVGQMARGAVAAVLAAGAAAPALAQLDGEPARTPSVRFESNWVALPLVDLPPGGGNPVRVDLTMLPNTPSALGLAAGVTTATVPLGAGQSALASTPSSLDLGLYWRQTLASRQRIDISAWRRMAASPPDAATLVQQRQASYGARVEMQLSGSGKGFVADKGFIGLQLEGGGRLMLRRSEGKPTLYYRVKF
ncbi:MAG TPA: hypothetical protein VLJ58_17380 [Ramlibacter sp.]|nr:hypothetical protein [Ramlibacter sp.]